MIFGSLLLLASFAHQATSMLINLNLTTATDSSNDLDAHCFTPETSPEMTEVSLRSCRAALQVLARNPDFTTPFRFSKNPRRGIKIPRAWTSGDCTIIMSCENDRDAYTFRFADVLVVAKWLVDTCVGTQESEKWGLLRWGGVHILGDSDTFYVSVGKLYTPTIPAGSVDLMELTSATALSPAIEDSR